MDRKLPLLVITGPTASGKSSLAVALAKRLNAEIISADSMQVYKHMDIGTAKISQTDMQDIPHHLIDFLDLSDQFSVAEYARLARHTITDICTRGHLPIMVGGTGLYIQAVVDNIDFFDLQSDIQLREELAEQAQRYGNLSLWAELNNIDPKLASDLHPNNLGRIIRAIEVYRITGKRMSDWKEESVSIPTPYHIKEIGIAYRDRNILYQMINERVDQMVAQGLLEETKWLYEHKALSTAKQAIGYKELWQVIEGAEELESALERLKQSTRHYAKRQLTWMRGRPNLEWIFQEDFDTFSEMEEFLYDDIEAWLSIN